MRKQYTLACQMDSVNKDKIDMTISCGNSRTEAPAAAVTAYHFMICLLLACSISINVLLFSIHCRLSGSVKVFSIFNIYERKFN